MDSNPTIAVLGTGGTIAGTAASATDHVGYQAARLGIQQLLQGLPALERFQLQAEQVAQVDSKDMSATTWLALAERARHWLERPEVRAVVVTHGTDTLEETAFFLQRVLASAKPVVLTCAMRPASALGSDGPQNLADALAVAASPGVHGVLAVCAGRVHGAHDIRKVHPYRVDAFGSGDAGPLAHVEQGALRLLRPWPVLQGTPALLAALRLRGQLPWVEIVQSHACADGRLVGLLVQAGAAGIVVAGTGNGSLHAALEAALCQAAQAGLRIVRTTRCAEGPVVGLPQQPFPSSDLSPVKARIALQLELLGAAAAR